MAVEDQEGCFFEEKEMFWRIVYVGEWREEGRFLGPW
jgi:hypothetical protein